MKKLIWLLLLLCLTMTAVSTATASSAATPAPTPSLAIDQRISFAATMAVRFADSSEGAANAQTLCRMTPKAATLAARLIADLSVHMYGEAHAKALNYTLGNLDLWNTYIGWKNNEVCVLWFDPAKCDMICCVGFDVTSGRAWYLLTPVSPAEKDNCQLAMKSWCENNDVEHRAITRTVLKTAITKLLEEQGPGAEVVVATTAPAATAKATATPRPAATPRRTATPRPTATPAPCSRCGGDGKLSGTCSDCKGKGKTTMTCPVCRGNRLVNCSNCGGTGRVPCRLCDASGLIRCASCNGRGTNALGTRICRLCNGSGKRECPTCDGTGRRHDFSCDGDGRKRCTNCSSGTVKVTCTECNGRGTYSGTCPDCKGTGKRSTTTTARATARPTATPRPGTSRSSGRNRFAGVFWTIPQELSGEAWNSAGVPDAGVILGYIKDGYALRIVYTAEDDGHVWICLPHSKAGWSGIGQNNPIKDGGCVYITSDMIEAAAGSNRSSWGAAMYIKGNTRWKVNKIEIVYWKD